MHVIDTSSWEVLDTLPIDGFCKRIIESRDHKTIWICSSTGLYEINADSLQDIHEHNFKSDLPGVGYYTMEMDEQERLWLAAAEGLIVFDPKHGTHRIYTAEDGLPQSEFRNASVRAENGELWFGANRAVTHFSRTRFPTSLSRLFPKLLTSKSMTGGMLANWSVKLLALQMSQQYKN